MTSAFSRLAAFSLALSLFTTQSEAQENLASHTLEFQQRHNQYVHVTLRLPVNSGQTELSLPNWTPGSYVIRDFSAHIEKMQARDAQGHAVEIEKVTKNRWRLATQGLTEISLSYDVWAGELHVSSSWIESDFALLNGAGIFLYSADSMEWPQEVTINLPESWNEIATSLEMIETGRRFRASSYHELLDSPIVAGDVKRYPFRTGGQGYVLVNVGETEFWDSERALQDLEKIVEVQQEFWKENPFDRDYLFLNFLLEFKGGLEHDHSTVMLSSGWAMRSRRDYIKWLGLVSHEFFHSWNVRRMRPEALTRYNYDEEVYTRELWLAEGITSYYDSLLLFRAGLVDVNEYFNLLATEIRNYETVPGRAVRSAELASFDSWIKHYVPDANSINSTVSYYHKGSLIGFVTDAAIRRETGSKASLDTVMRKMYQQYGPRGPGKGSYPPGAFERVVEEIAGAEVRAMVEELLRSTIDPDVDEALEWYGLKLGRAPSLAAAEKAGLPAPAGFGVTWNTDESLLKVENVVKGGAAAKAGVIPGDELLAINGLRVLPKTIESRIQSLLPGEWVELTMVRHDRIMPVKLQLQHAIPEEYVITSDDKISRWEKARLEKWLEIKLRINQ